MSNDSYSIILLSVSDKKNQTFIFTSAKLQVLATTRKVARTHDPHFNSVIVHVDDIESSELTRLFKTSLKVRNGVVVVVVVLLLLVVIISQVFVT